MKIKYHSEARKEFFEVAEYYEKQVVGLGDEFIYEVEKVLDIILQQPFIGSKITSTERRFLTIYLQTSSATKKRLRHWEAKARLLETPHLK
jgi:CRISPR/Cas system CMR subunit Cmr6 (Cas7 group RAMP superfamily)